MSKDLSKIVFICILVLAFYLRLHGITNGFPFIFHADEPTIVRSALGVRFFPNPGHFDWPHLYIYINYFFFMGFAKVRDLLTMYDLRATVERIFPIIWDDELIYYFITRFLTTTLGALTIIPVYLTAKKLFGIKAGLLSALAFTLIPFHIRHSHYALPDAPMVFFLAWAMYFSSKILVKKDPLNYAGAGVYTGFAASTKYHGGLGAGMVPLAHIMRIIKNKESFLEISNILNIMVSGILAVIAFIIGTPYSVMDYKTFIRNDGPQGSLWQFKNVGSVSFIERPSKFFSELFYRVSDDLGYVFIGVFFVVLIILTIKLVIRKTLTIDIYAWFIWLYGLILLFYISGFERPRSHYYMIAYPFIAVCFGYFGSLLFEKVESKIKIGVFLIYALLFVLPLFYSVKETYTFGNPDTRNILDQWISKNAQNSNLIYTSDDFKQVMDKYEKNSFKGSQYLDSFASGYVIASEKTVGTENSFGLLKYSASLKEVLTINNEYRNGPKIKIYQINK